jgi:hypothetical protein
MADLRAISTRFDGYHFRSRLEARWAVFFKAMAIKYYYEREGYDLEGVYYLPDFQIPRIEINEAKGTWRESENCCYVEIKPTQPTHSEITKAAKLAKLSGRPVAIVSGEPYQDCYEITLLRKTSSKTYAHLVEENIAAVPWRGEKLRRSFWALFGYWGVLLEERASLLGDIESAYLQAREARFEPSDEDRIYGQG